MLAKSIYIHIPFCSKKCYYCDFTAYVPNQENQVDKYLQALVKEMELMVQIYPPEKVETIFIGGGTPTILSPSQMEFLLSNLKKYFPIWADDYEFTVEANPETTNSDLLTTMRFGGVNRISFGAQTFNSTLLTDIGRVHGVEDIIRSVQSAREEGIQNVSLDLMFGLPNQTLEDMRETLYKTLALNPDHLSCYSLKVEEGTRFHALQLQNKLPLPSEDHEFKMYQLIRTFLKEKGYLQYEISNFSRIGKESRHNITYWRNEGYYGVGTGAHGYLNGHRYGNVRSIKEYLQLCEMKQLPIDEIVEVTPKEDKENFMILGLRLMDGISKSRFASRYKEKVNDVYGEVLAKLEMQGFLVNTDGRAYLTEKGILFGNDVFSSFL